MIGLRLVRSAVVTLLLVATHAAPAPAPYHPAVGEIVHLRPSQTHGGASVGTGADIPHPHIALGTDSERNGHHIVAPVTSSPADNLRPYMPMPATGMLGLHGVIRLDRVTAHHSVISGSQGSTRSARVGRHNIQTIRQAKDLVQSHLAASHAHTKAAESHEAMAESHNTLSSFHHHRVGESELGQHHATQANDHQQKANDHHQAANNHHQAAHNVHGPDQNRLAHAQTSAKEALEASSHIKAAKSHLDNAKNYAAYQSMAVATNHRKLALQAHQQATQ
ncbi:hypothetical protein BDZ97DRAFT_1834430 [Flammula alnicola]|nr:hypothetical protein BDZ97DRAFT_1834430 [Flammula alnicola]